MVSCVREISCLDDVIVRTLLYVVPDVSKREEGIDVATSYL